MALMNVGHSSEKAHQAIIEMGGKATSDFQTPRGQTKAGGGKDDEALGWGERHDSQRDQRRSYMKQISIVVGGSQAGTDDMGGAKPGGEFFIGRMDLV